MIRYSFILIFVLLSSCSTVQSKCKAQLSEITHLNIRISEIDKQIVKTMVYTKLKKQDIFSADEFWVAMMLSSRDSIEILMKERMQLVDKSAIIQRNNTSCGKYLQ